MRVIFLIGVSGSGKTTFREKFLQENKNFLLINRDSLRKSIFGDNFQKNGYYGDTEINIKELMINSMQEKIIEFAINKQFNLFVDNTNLKLKDIYQLKELLPDTYFPEYIFIETNDISVNKQRVMLRDGITDVSYIDKQYNQYKLIKSLLKDFSHEVRFN